MKPDQLKGKKIEREFVFVASRGSGPGGQNVNKVSTKVELRFDLLSTLLFTEKEKQLIFRKLKNKINKDGELILVSQSERSQLLNKEAAVEKFYDLVSKSLTVPVKRKSTKPTLASKRKRLNEKKSRGLKKKLRQKSGGSDEEDY
jgi:ribosome-associated protein